MRAIGRGIGRFFAWLGVTILGLVLILVLIVTMIVHGPSAQAKNLFVTTMLETGQAKWAVGLFLSKEEIEGVGFQYCPYEEMVARYPVDTLKDGWNVMPDGEEIYYISNPALGLWAYPERFKD